MVKSNTGLKKMIGVAMLAALGYVLMIVSFPIPAMPPYLKMDFSDIPVLLGMFLYGPVSGVVIAAIQNTLHFVMSGDITGLPIGELASFVSTMSFTLPIYFYLGRLFKKKEDIGLRKLQVSVLLGTVSLALIMSVTNYFIFTPIYIHFLGYSFGPMREVIIAGILPFNLIKGTATSIVFILIFSNLKVWILKNSQHLKA